MRKSSGVCISSANPRCEDSSDVERCWARNLLGILWVDAADLASNEYEGFDENGFEERAKFRYSYSYIPFLNIVLEDDEKDFREMLRPSQEP